ncbi:hypothetical protein ID852_00830 [Xenorhabdus sp. 42]|uniref:hypothetical protein n=2 Tax=Xenorhabdus szentirmaii TaxID=290112 RepID=UPI00198F65AB|nr:MULTISPECIES: hypothetical protein [unclassified Xenorhabdus]MBD2805063.1 hypothetical protein [Xenorhabdus sp. ZM]MBD2819261.1 hypothetical protein [Xenorhabdus sp. 42]MBD2826181.1 hypothetical protein [Xenorhabdus sp. 5]
MMDFHPKNYLSGRKSILVTLFIISFSVFYFYTYKQINIVEKIFDYTDKHCHVNEECVVNMANVTSFEWDYMYLINSGFEHKRVESFVNLKLDMNLEFSQHIIFTKDNKLVHHEGYFYYPDTSGRKALLLNFDDFKNGIKPIKYYVMSKDNAKVLIKKEIVPNFQDYRDYYWFSYTNENQAVRGDVIYQEPTKN